MSSNFKQPNNLAKCFVTVKFYKQTKITQKLIKIDIVREPYVGTEIKSEISKAIKNLWQAVVAHLVNYFLLVENYGKLCIELKEAPV